MTIIYLLIGIIAIITYHNEKYVLFMISFMALFTNLFMFLPAVQEGVRGTDVALVSSVIILISNGKKNVNNDKYYKYCIYILCFTIFQLFYTIIIEAETITFALKVLRIPALICFALVVRMIPIPKIKKFIKVAFIVTVIDGIFFYLEFLGLDILPDVDPLQAMLSLGSASSCTIPVFTILFLFICLSGAFNIKYKNLFLLFFLGILILTFVRTWLYGFMICAIFLLYLRKSDKKTIFRYVAIGAIALPVILNVVGKKESNSSASSHSDFQNIISGEFLNPENNLNAANGTFAFRISMCVERFYYLIDNPRYLLLGTGAIHEGSPKNRFNFYLGTHNQMYDRCMIESGDITWVPIVLRYGIIGTLLYLYFFILLIKRFFRRSDEYCILAPIALMYLIMSFSGAFFERAECYLIIGLLLGVCSRLELSEDCK